MVPRAFKDLPLRDMNPEDLPEEIILDGCSCGCALEIDVEMFDGVYFAGTFEVPGLLGQGDCEEEVVNNLLEFIDSIPRN